MATSSRVVAAQRRLRAAELAAEHARQRLEDAILAAENAEKEPKEPKKGSVIKFQVQYRNDEQVYSFVAHRGTNGLWYLTNREGHFNWEYMLDLMGKDVTAKQLGIQFFLFGEKGGKWMGREQ